MEKPPTLEDLQVLNINPPGSEGEKQGREMLQALLTLGEEHGYGQVSRLAEWIEDIWRHPEHKEKYAHMKEVALDMMAQAREAKAAGE